MTTAITLPGTAPLPAVIDAPAPDLDPVRVYLAGYPAANSRRSMRSSLDVLARLATGDGAATADRIPWGRLTFAYVNALRAKLAERYAPKSANRHLSALKGILRTAWRLGLMTAEELARAIDVKEIPGRSAPVGRYVDPPEAARLFEAARAGETPIDKRDAAVFAVMYGCGLRRSEAVGIDLADYESETGRLKIHGKGSKERIVWVPSKARPDVDAWLALRGPEAGALFVAMPNGAVTVPPRRLTDKTVARILERLSLVAEIDAFATHDLRRSLISGLLDKGVDLPTVAQIVGHSNVTTTARYDRRPERVRQAAAELVEIPIP